MDLKRLPYLPLHFFVDQMPRAQRWVFALSMALLAALTGLWLAQALLPSLWAPSLEEVQEVAERSSTLDAGTFQWRQFSVELPVFLQWISNAAGPLQPQAWMPLLFWAAQVLAWSLWMMALTGVRSWLFWLLGAVYAIFLFQSGVGSLLLPEQSYLVPGGFALLSLGLAWLFQSGRLRLPGIGRLLLWLGLHGALFGTALLREGWLAGLSMAGDGFTFSAVFSLLFILFIAKEPTNLLILVTTHHQEAARRLAPRWILLAGILLLLAEGLWLLSYLNLGLEGWQPGFRPAHMLAIAALFTVFTSQNHFHQLRRLIASSESYTFLLLAWALSVAAFWFLGSASGDQIFTYAFERVAALLFVAVGIGHLFFIFTNHRPLLQMRVHLYYLLAEGPVFSVIVIWVTGLLGLILAEGRENWKTAPLLASSYRVQAGDLLMLAGAPELAARRYEDAALLVQGHDKALYNRGSLLLTEEATFAEALESYAQASLRGGQPWGALNAFSWLRAGGNDSAALALLDKTRAAGLRHPLLSQARALALYRLGQPDSAILALKEALREDPDLASAYSNLALIYLEQDREADARAFMAEALRTRGASSLVRANAAACALLLPESALELPSPQQGEDYSYLHNYSLLPGRGLPPEARAALRAAANEGRPAAMLLDGLLLLRADSPQVALSRIQVLADLDSTLAAPAYQLLGSYFYGAGAPELAQHYFETAAAFGSGSAALEAAVTLAELGQGDSAFARLTALRASHPGLQARIAQEAALLLYVYSGETYAEAERPFGQWGAGDWIRAGRYADSLRQFTLALGAFRRALEADSSRADGYVEMARIYNRYGDPRALSDLDFALSRFPGHTALHAARAEALQAQGQAGAPIPLDGSPEAPQLRLRWMARQALAARDTALALTRLDSLLRIRPYETESIRLALAVLHARGELQAGNQLATAAVNVNAFDPELWYYYALFSRAYGMGRDAGFAAAKAISLSSDERRKQEIAAEFAAEIREIAQNP